MPSILPLVEIIAPTPVMMSRELAPSGELPRVMRWTRGMGLWAAACRCHPRIVPSPLTRIVPSRLDWPNPRLPALMQQSPPTAQVSPVIEEEPVVPQPPSFPAINRRSSRLDEAPNPVVPQRVPPPRKHQESTTLPQLPPHTSTPGSPYIPWYTARLSADPPPSLWNTSNEWAFLPRCCILRLSRGR
jgi:hypothetical protein